MLKTMKYVLAMTCVLAMCCMLIPVGVATAEEPVPDENMNATAHYFDYEVLEDGTISITGYTPVEIDVKGQAFTSSMESDIVSRITSRIGENKCTIRFFD